jgi:HTH-type transcriptional regulator, competence development regulator
MAPNRNPLVSPADRGPLGQYLWDLRHATGMTLREVEEVSGVSNAYVSQLETGKIKITKPSPDILHRLCEAYATRMPRNAPLTCSFERMMELAGHIMPEKTTGRRAGRLPTFAKEKLTAEEEDELLRYLAFMRMRKGKK